jgi:hypothetical protein
MKKITFSLLFIFLFLESFSQRNIGEENLSFPMIGAIAAYQFPGGDLTERFGSNFNVGCVFQWKFKNNWLVGVEGNFLFGDNVDENNILDKYKTPDGNIIDGSGQFGVVALSQRGFKVELKGGKIFPFIGPNPNSGMMTTIGFGYFQHKIRIETPGSPIPYLEEEYIKGYDRLCGGLSVTEFIGYINFSNKRLVNYYCGFEFTQGFTSNLREMNFDTGKTDTGSRLDLLFGIRLGWVFPLYKRTADKSYSN